jgi:nitronate monooxygenase
MNKLCEKLGIKYPIIQAGMAGGATTPELVSAVSNAGGLGILAASRLTPTQLKEAILKIKSKTQNPRIASITRRHYVKIRHHDKYHHTGL